jgi:hypothetical protein
MVLTGHLSPGIGGCLGAGSPAAADRLSRLADPRRSRMSGRPAMLQLAAVHFERQRGTRRSGAARGSKACVKSFKFDRDSVYTDADLNAVREQLKAPWTRMVNAEQGQSVKCKSTAAERSNSGRPAEPRQLTVVSIVGQIDRTQLGALGGQLGTGASEHLAPGPGACPITAILGHSTSRWHSVESPLRTSWRRERVR